MEELQTQTLLFREIRNVPESINAAVDFLRLHRQSLGRLILTRLLPIIIFGQILSAFLTDEISPFGGAAYSSGGDSRVLLLIISLCLEIITFLFTTSFVFAALRLGERYAPDEYGREDIWQEAKDLFLRVLGTNVGLFFLLGIGSLFLNVVALRSLLTIPLIGPVLVVCYLCYFTVMLSLYYPARFVEDYSFFASMRRSYWLVQGAFWKTFSFLSLWALLLIGWTAFSSIFSFLVSEDVVSGVWVVENRSLLLAIFALLNILLGSLVKLLSIPFFVSLTFYYFSQSERKEYPTLEAATEMMGQRTETDETEPTSDRVIPTKSGVQGEKTDREDSSAQRFNFPPAVSNLDGGNVNG